MDGSTNQVACRTCKQWNPRPSGVGHCSIGVGFMRYFDSCKDWDGMTNERKNITQPADWWAAWKAAADAEGKSLSAWIGEQCNASLKAKTQKQLSERGTRGRPATPKD